MVSAIIVAAGSSRRMGFDKLSALLDGRSVLETTVRALAESGFFSQIVLVTTPERWQEAEGWLENIQQATGVSMVFASGGAERHDSVAAGLSALAEKTQWVAVHDGARPLVSQSDIGQVIEIAQETGAASLAHPIVETVKRANAQAVVTETVDRQGLWAMETPQVFNVSLLKDAYQRAFARGDILTDEVSAVQAAGLPVQLVSSSSWNIKITHPRDLKFAEQLIRTAKE